MNRTTLVLVTGFVLLWNSGFIGAVYGLPYTGPFTLLFWRYLALTLVIFLYLLVRKRFRWVGWKVATPNMLIGVLVLPAIFIEKLSTQWEPEFIYSMVWLILAVSLGAYALMWLLIERIDATRVASLFYLGPPVTMFMAWLAFGDKVQIMDLVGLTIVFVGVLLSQLKIKESRIK